MSAPRHLTKAPVREAIFEFGFPRTLEKDGSIFEQLKPILASRFPSASPILILEGNFRFDGGGPQVNPTARLVSGWSFNSPTEAIQFRIDGFSYHKLSPYSSWEEIIKDFKYYWELCLSVNPVKHITRIGVRYINAFSIPWGAEAWDMHLIAPPASCFQDDNARQFLTRAFYKDDSLGLQTTILQSIEKKDSSSAVVFDIQLALAFPAGKTTLDPIIWQSLESMRAIKNKRFFDLLHESLTRTFE